MQKELLQEEQFKKQKHVITKSMITSVMLQDGQSFYHATKLATHLQDMHHVSVGKCALPV